MNRLDGVFQGYAIDSLVCRVCRQSIFIMKFKRGLHTGHYECWPSSGILRSLRPGIRHSIEDPCLSKENFGVAIRDDESSSMARTSRYELGVHEPQSPRQDSLQPVLGVPVAYMYREDDKVAALLLALHKLKQGVRDR